MASPFQRSRAGALAAITCGRACNANILACSCTRARATDQAYLLVQDALRRTVRQLLIEQYGFRYPYTLQPRVEAGSARARAGDGAELSVCEAVVCRSEVASFRIMSSDALGTPWGSATGGVGVLEVDVRVSFGSSPQSGARFGLSSRDGLSVLRL